MKPMSVRIDQFAPAVAVGDGVTNSLLFIRSLLRELGYASDIYTFSCPAGLQAEIHDAQRFDAQQCDLLLYHHSMGHEQGEWLLALACPCALVYHNITPAPFFAAGSVLHHYADLGRQQLSAWRERFVAALAVSALNAAELREADYTEVLTLPLLVDLTRLGGEQQKPAFLAAQPADAELYLAIGRLAENKRQYLLIEAFYHLCKQRGTDFARRARLLLAGGTTSEDYASGLHQYVAALGLLGRVLLPGKCSDAELRWLYAHARQYWCASAHEGFCMPLIEAAQADLPVLALATSNIPDTLGEGGLLLEGDDPLSFALASWQLEQQPCLRAQVVAGGQRNLQRYARPLLVEQLGQWCRQRLAALPAMQRQPLSGSC